MTHLISLTMKEVSRYDVIQRLIRTDINGTEAATQLGLSVRHIRRLKGAVLTYGAEGLAHGNRGKPSNRKTKPFVEKKALRHITKHYRDFGPTLAAEKLKEHHQIVFSVEKVRQLMTTENLWKPRPRKQNKQYRSWRPRKEHYGEMQQFDGSYHRWFEKRAPECCLLASIDDATGHITKAVFADNESVQSVFWFWSRYVERQGKPVALYLDKYSTYKVNHASAVDNSDLMTQFERVVKELDIKLITAHSPQAKGRIERLFETLQDRLVKELRLRGISDKDTANRFLEEEFIPWFNKKFGVVPVQSADLHRKINRQEQLALPAIFSVQSARKVQNDFTIRFKNQWLQLEEKQPVTVCRKDTVRIEERLDGSIHIRHERRGKYLDFTTLPERPKRVIQTPVLTTTTGVKSPWKPPVNHPWRQPFLAKKSRRRYEKTKQPLLV